MCSKFLSFRATFCFANPDYRLISMTSPSSKLKWDQYLEPSESFQGCESRQTVKYGRESRGTRNQESLGKRGLAAI
jgi:hypothetical protein